MRSPLGGAASSCFLCSAHIRIARDVFSCLLLPAAFALRGPYPACEYATFLATLPLCLSSCRTSTVWLLACVGGEGVVSTALAPI